MHQRKLSNIELCIHDVDAGKFEIETFEEFEERVLQTGQKDLSPYVFQEVDFSSMTREQWEELQLKVRGAWFIGCQPPRGVERDQLTRAGAVVLVNDPALPFKPFRAFLYSQPEMAKHGERIFRYSKAHHDLRSKLFYSAHDFSISDALFDCVAGKTVVSFMGGHALARRDPLYRLVVRVAWSLARQGFVIATGGGPGAMEAGCLGAYLAVSGSEEDVEEALRIIGTPSGKVVEHEYEDDYPARQVLARFGAAERMPSLGVPTFFYGHEPSNLFASLHAKYFDNAIREDMLIKISNGGIIFAPGSAGTRQELFQAACLNHYADPGKDFPTVFLGSDFWSSPDIYTLFTQVAAPHPYAQWILKSDAPSDIVELLLRHAHQKGLPLLSSDALHLGVTPHLKT